MNRRRTAALAAGAVLLLGGLVTGCTAADASDPRPEPPAGAPADGQPGGMDTSQLAKALADGLGIDEAKAKEAVDKAFSEVMGGARGRGDRPEGAPSEADRPESGKPSTSPSTTPSTEPSTTPGGGTPSAPSTTPSAPQEKPAGLAEELAEVIADELDADQAKVLDIVQQNLPEPPQQGPGQGGEAPGGERRGGEDGRGPRP